MSVRPEDRLSAMSCWEPAALATACPALHVAEDPREGLPQVLHGVLCVLPSARGGALPSEHPAAASSQARRGTHRADSTRQGD